MKTWKIKTWLEEKSWLRKTWFCNFFCNCYSLDHHNKSITELCSFRIGNFIILFVSGLLIFLAIVNGDYTLSLDNPGFKVFLEDFKFQIGIAALTIPYSALIASIHRSFQAKEQIENLIQTTNSANCFKHFEEFSDFFEKDEHKEIRKDIISLKRSYLHLFPHSKNGDFLLSSNYIETVIKSFYLRSQDILKSKNASDLYENINHCEIFFSMVLDRNSLPHNNYKLKIPSIESHIRYLLLVFEFNRNSFFTSKNEFGQESNLFNNLSGRFNFLKEKIEDSKGVKFEENEKLKIALEAIKNSFTIYLESKSKPQ